ncbi:hypothetical protein [Caminibacter sp.]
MNKRILILVGILMVLITVFVYKTYLNTKKELDYTYEYSTKIQKTAKEIIAIKNLNRINLYFCKKENSKFICKNMDKNKFYAFQNALKKALIKNFDITKNKKYADAILEIEK